MCSRTRFKAERLQGFIKLLLLLVAYGSSFGSKAAETVESSRDATGNKPPAFDPRTADLWLLSGQSNMVGWGLVKDEITTD